MKKAIKALSKAVGAANSDKFEDGDVIRWQAKSGYSGILYTYAACRAGGQWYLTQATGRVNTYYPDAPWSYDELTEVLGRADVSSVFVATEWTALDGTAYPALDEGEAL